jgi:prepilin-type N-terminal cleavage/methylation domain-containing protein
MRRETGFTILEVLIALVLLATAVAGVASLVSVGTKSGDAARRKTMATLLATQKMEQLLALTWRFDPAGSGLPDSDTTSDLSFDPPQAGGSGLDPSPASSLQSNTAGYADFLDGAGRWVGRGTFAPPDAVFARRWSVQALPLDADGRVIQVLVETVGRRATVGGAPVVLTSVRTRKHS